MICSRCAVCCGRHPQTLSGAPPSSSAQLCVCCHQAPSHSFQRNALGSIDAATSSGRAALQSICRRRGRANVTACGAERRTGDADTTMWAGDAVVLLLTQLVRPCARDAARTANAAARRCCRQQPLDLHYVGMSLDQRQFCCEDFVLLATRCPCPCKTFSFRRQDGEISFET